MSSSNAFSSVIPLSEAKLLNMKKCDFVVSLYEKWKITMCVPLRNVFTEDQHRLTLLHMEKYINQFK